jgi:hypothetical protein
MTSSCIGEFETSTLLIIDNEEASESPLEGPVRLPKYAMASQPLEDEILPVVFSIPPPIYTKFPLGSTSREAVHICLLRIQVRMKCTDNNS